MNVQDQMDFKVDFTKHLKKNWGTWMAQSVKLPTLAQVMILPSMSSGPALASVLTAQSLEPVSDSVSPSLSAPSLLSLSLSVSLSKINKH